MSALQSNINILRNPGKVWAPIIVPTIFAVLLIAGILGNSIIIYIILRHKYMQVTPNLYILNLAIGDLFLLVFSAPFTALSYVFDTYPFGIVLCKIDQTSQNVTLGITIFTLMALSYDRCSSIRDPIISHTNRSYRAKRSQIGIFLIWFCAIMFCIPDAIFTTLVSQPKFMTNFSIESQYNINNHSNYNYELYNTSNSYINKIAFSKNNKTSIIHNDTHFLVCYPYLEINHDSPHIYMKTRVILRFLVYFLVPILVIATFYTIIAVVLMRPFNTYIATDNVNQNNDLQRNKNTILERLESFKGKKKRKKLSIYSTNTNDTNSEVTDVLELKNVQLDSSKTKIINSISMGNSKSVNYTINRRHAKARLKIVKMVLFLVVIFILLCLPEHIYYFLWYFTQINFNEGLLVFKIFCKCAFYAHSSLHAYVLFCLSSKFRYYGQDLISKCNKKILDRASSQQN